MQAQSIEVAHDYSQKQQYNKADWFQRLKTEACYQHGWEQGSLLPATTLSPQQVISSNLLIAYFYVVFPLL